MRRPCRIALSDQSDRSRVMYPSTFKRALRIASKLSAFLLLLTACGSNPDVVTGLSAAGSGGSGIEPGAGSGGASTIDPGTQGGSTAQAGDSGAEVPCGNGTL